VVKKEHKNQKIHLL